MAITCQTSRWVSSAPYVKLTVEQESSTGDSAVYSWKLQYIASSAANTSSSRSYVVKIDGDTVRSGSYNIDGKSGTWTIASGTKTLNRGTSARTVKIYCSFAFNLTWSGSYAGTKTASDTFTFAKKTSYTIAYNGNGGTGAPASQTKWYGDDLTLSSAVPTLAGHTFKGWATEEGGAVAYAPGATCSTDAALTLYAVWEAPAYTITLNANGGTVSPASIPKSHDIAITLPTPTRPDYTFLGWSTSASSSMIAYKPGASYNGNADATLYAVWEKNYTKPIITSYSVERCDASGKVSDEGTCAKVVFNWTCSKSVSYIEVAWRATTESAETTADITASGTSGTINTIVGAGTLSTEKAYNVEVRVADAGGMSFAVRTLGGAAYPIDFLVGGRGTAVGKPAEVPELFDVGWLARFRNDLMTGAKEGYLDGKQGIYLDSEGFMHLQRTTEQGFHPYIGFFLDAATTAAGMIRLNSGDKVMEFLNALGYAFGNDIIFKNNDSHIFGHDPNGVKKSVFTPQNVDGNTILGYANYTGASGDTNICGHDINHFVSNLAAPGSYRPYYRAGDVITVDIRTAGYCTNSKKDVYFVVPLSKPVIGNPTVSCASIDGLILRQGGEYTHATASGTYRKPNAYDESINADGNFIQIKATMESTTNAVSNETIGVFWSGTITFS